MLGLRHHSFRCPEGDRRSGTQANFVSAFIQVPEQISAQQRLIFFAFHVRPPPSV